LAPNDHPRNKPLVRKNSIIFVEVYFAYEILSNITQIFSITV